LPSLRSGVLCEVDHHDGVLLHDADEHDDPHQGVRFRSIPKTIRVRSAPIPADGRPRGW
jgi:hypothetical protein